MTIIKQKKYNPFRPGSIVAPGVFSGRFDELAKIDQILFQTKFGNPQHFLLHGERGIGKSSLLFCVDYVARGEIKPFEGEPFYFLTLNVALETSNSEIDVPRKIAYELKRQIGKHNASKKLAKDFWDFITRWEVMGVKYATPQGQNQTDNMIDDLVTAVENIVNAGKGDIDGILILIDEADKAPVSANLGAFCKLFTEKLTKRNCNNVCIGMAGLSTVIQTLKRSHESSPRIFNHFRLEPLSDSEREDVIIKGLEEANGKNKVPTTITPEATKFISFHSEGYPSFIQQFAYCAYDSDTDDVIDYADALSGAYSENGAFQQLGTKYFHDLYFDQINSEQYRLVLQAMAEHFDKWVTKAQIRQETLLKETILKNALLTLIKRHIIMAKEGQAGVYKLPSRSFAVWIKAFRSIPNREIPNFGDEHIEANDTE